MSGRGSQRRRRCLAVAVAAPARQTPSAPGSSGSRLRRACRLSRSRRACWSRLLGIAAAARWPNLWLIPTFTDETIEVKLAYDIARGRSAPLTNVDPYIGAFWNWVLAVGFWTFGLNPWLPRLLAFVGGVATVGAAWWLGREMGGRIGGRWWRRCSWPAARRTSW